MRLSQWAVVVMGCAVIPFLVWGLVRPMSHLAQTILVCAVLTVPALLLGRRIGRWSIRRWPPK